MKLLLLFAAALLPILSQAQSFHVDIDRNRDRDYDSEHQHYRWWYHKHHHEHGFLRTYREWDSDYGVWIIRRGWVEEEPD